MIPYTFEYERAGSLADAERMIKGTPEAKLLAGGQTLVAAMKLRLARPSKLVDISGVKELRFIRLANGMLSIGAATVHADVAASAEIAREIPALAALAGMIGDPAVRHMGTIGGSVANNDPAADYPAAVLGLGATVVTTRRAIKSDAFFKGMFETALDDGEIVKEIAFPIPERAGYRKFPNPASRYALVGVFIAKTKNQVRVAVTGAAPCVFRVPAMEAALARDFTPQAIADIKIDESGMNSDIHGSARYRAHLVGVMARRAVSDALR
jgi:carbon-monoxide dehydrogenase medium subunit